MSDIDNMQDAYKNRATILLVWIDDKSALPEADGSQEQGPPRARCSAAQRFSRLCVIYALSVIKRRYCDQ